MNEALTKRPEGYQKIRIATPGYTIPTKDPITDTRDVDQNLTIYSKLSKIEATYLLQRDLPPENILGPFMDLLNLWGGDDPKKERVGGLCKTVKLTGEASAGKTSMATLAAKLIDGKDPIYFDAGNRSIDHLMAEPIFDSDGEGIDIIKEIEDKFNGVSFPPLNEYYTEIIKNELKTAVGTDGKLSLKKVANQQNLELIETIADASGIKKGGGMLGIKIVEGPLIRACKEGRKLVIDELDKSLDGTGMSLQQVLLVLKDGGEYTFEQQGIRFTFNKNTVKQGIGIIATANDGRDGGEITAQKQSTMSRFAITINVGDVTKETIAQRLFQTLTRYNPWCLEDQGKGASTGEDYIRLAEYAGEPRTEEEKILLRNWKKTLEAARRLGDFYKGWEGLVKKDEGTVQDEKLELQRDISLVMPGIRFAQEIIKDAREFKSYQKVIAEPTSLEEYLEEMLNSKEDEIKPITQGLGEKLQILIRKRIREYAGGEITKTAILETARLAKVLPEPDEEGNPNEKTDSFAQLLNTIQNEMAIDTETEALHAKLCERLKKQYNLKANERVEDILTVAQLQTAIDKEKLLAAEKSTKTKKYIIGINPNFGNEKGKSQPITTIPILDTRDTQELKEYGLITETIDKNGEKTIKANREALLAGAMETGELIEIITHRGLREELIDALWAPEEKTSEVKKEESKETIDATDEASLAAAKVIDTIRGSLTGSGETFRACVLTTKHVTTKQEQEINPAAPKETTERIVLAQSRTKNKIWVYAPNEKEFTTEGLQITNNSKKFEEAIKKALPEFSKEKETIEEALGVFLEEDQIADTITIGGSLIPKIVEAATDPTKRVKFGKFPIKTKKQNSKTNKEAEVPTI